MSEDCLGLSREYFFGLLSADAADVSPNSYNLTMWNTLVDRVPTERYAKATGR